MGKKHRQQRAADKKVIRLNHYRVDEFGERHRVITKAEARRRLIDAIHLRRQIEYELIDALVAKAREDIYAIEDANVFADIERCLAPAPAP
jgi:hypothetical protein